MHEKKRYRVGNVSETFIQNSYINSVGRVLVLWAKGRGAVSSAPHRMTNSAVESGSSEKMKNS